MPRTPATVLRSIGKNAPSDTAASFEVSPTPSTTIKRGKNASRGIGWMAARWGEWGNGRGSGAGGGGVDGWTRPARGGCGRARGEREPRGAPRGAGEGAAGAAERGGEVRPGPRGGDHP